MKTLLPLLAALLLLPGCSGPPPAPIVTASYPAHFLVERIVAGELALHPLGHPGVDLHAYEPTVRDVAALRGARVVVIHGLGVEAWVERVIASLDAAPLVVAATDIPGGLDLRAMEEADGHDRHGEEGEPAHEEGTEEAHGHDHGGTDPHTWLDPLLYAAEARHVAAALASAFPERADAFQARGGALAAELEGLHQEFAQGLQGCGRDEIAVNHDAYGHLARRYGFAVHSLQGLEPHSQPSPQAVQAVIQAIRDEGIPVLFLEEGTDPGAVAAIQEETGVAVRVLNTAESQPPQGDYLSLQRENLANLQIALGCA